MKKLLYEIYKNLLLLANKEIDLDNLILFLKVR